MGLFFGSNPEKEETKKRVKAGTAAITGIVSGLDSATSPELGEALLRNAYAPDTNLGQVFGTRKPNQTLQKFVGRSFNKAVATEIRRLRTAVLAGNDAAAEQLDTLLSRLNAVASGVRELDTPLRDINLKIDTLTQGDSPLNVAELLKYSPLSAIGGDAIASVTSSATLKNAIVEGAAASYLSNAEGTRNYLVGLNAALGGIEQGKAEFSSNLLPVIDQALTAANVPSRSIERALGAVLPAMSEGQISELRSVAGTGADLKALCAIALRAEYAKGRDTGAEALAQAIEICRGLGRAEPKVQQIETKLNGLVDRGLPTGALAQVLIQAGLFDASQTDSLSALTPEALGETVAATIRDKYIADAGATTGLVDEKIDPALTKLGTDWDQIGAATASATAEIEKILKLPAGLEAGRNQVESILGRAADQYAKLPSATDVDWKTELTDLSAQLGARTKNVFTELLLAGKPEQMEELQAALSYTASGETTNDTATSNSATSLGRQRRQRGFRTWRRRIGITALLGLIGFGGWQFWRNRGNDNAKPAQPHVSQVHNKQTGTGALRIFSPSAGNQHTMQTMHQPQLAQPPEQDVPKLILASDKNNLDRNLRQLTRLAREEIERLQYIHGQSQGWFTPEQIAKAASRGRKPEHNAKTKRLRAKWIQDASAALDGKAPKDFMMKLRQALATAINSGMKTTNRYALESEIGSLVSTRSEMRKTLEEQQSGI